MLRRMILGFAVLLSGLFALGFALPDAVHVERSTHIEAEPETVFALVSDFKAWERWSPWAELDPGAEIVVEGSGVGQVMRWRGDEAGAGAGVQRVTALVRPSRMASELDFGDMGRATAFFRIEPADQGGVVVTWGLDSRMREGAPFLMRPMATYLGFFMDGMIGADYERGLANLKREAEAQ